MIHGNFIPARLTSLRGSTGMAIRVGGLSGTVTTLPSSPNSAPRSETSWSLKPDQAECGYDTIRTIERWFPKYDVMYEDEGDRLPHYWVKRTLNPRERELLRERFERDDYVILGIVWDNGLKPLETQLRRTRHLLMLRLKEARIWNRISE